MKTEKIPIDQIELSPIQAKHDPAAVMIIHFEFQGQDFDSWAVNKDGVVLSSIPWQTEIWKDTHVNLEKLEIGKEPMILTRFGDFLTLNYKVTNIELQ